jgi:serine/threonine protein kinase
MMEQKAKPSYYEALSHSNIAAIFGLEESGDRKFLVMELISGETLAERIKVMAGYSLTKS